MSHNERAPVSEVDPQNDSRDDVRPSDRCSATLVYWGREAAVLSSRVWRITGRPEWDAAKRACRDVDQATHEQPA